MRKAARLFWLVFIPTFLTVSVASAQAPQWSVPESKQLRVIIDSDAANETDDQAIIAYALLSPALVVRGLVATHFRPHTGSPVQDVSESMEASYQEINEIAHIMRLEGCFPIRRGSPTPFADPSEPAHSEGADLIIEEALRDGPRPLFVLFLGSATDLAAAYLKNPEIAKRLTAVWVGGMGYPKGGPGYNVMGDPIAANVLMESDIPLWQIPLPVYLLPRFSMAEAAEKIGQQGELGRFLFDRLERFVSVFPSSVEFWQYADLPAIAILLQQPWMATFKDIPAPTIAPSGYYVHNGKNRTIRVFHSFDHRAALEDLYAKLAAFARGDLQPMCRKE